jgi:hypothetical protein
MKNINELIEVNLKLLSEVNRNSMFFDDFIDCDGNELHATFRTDFFASEMEKRGLISITNFICFITEFGLNIVENGGWNKYLTETKNAEILSQKQKSIRDKLETDLAKSNLEANELNRKIAKQNKENEKKNRVSTWINIGIGFINILLLIWQILKSE